jgi:hypothetical protein
LRWHFHRPALLFFPYCGWLSSAHWIIDLYAQHWALREITTCSPQCGLLTFFSPPFPANNVVVIVVSRLVILRRVFVVPSPHRPHSLLLSKGHSRHGPAAGRLLGPF